MNLSKKYTHQVSSKRYFLSYSLMIVALSITTVLGIRFLRIEDLDIALLFIGVEFVFYFILAMFIREWIVIPCEK